MKKNIFYISLMSCVFCLTASVSHSATFVETLTTYCVPKKGNSCDPKTEKATFTSAGCSCYIGREYNADDRKCEECLLKGGGYNGYYKSKEGVEGCSQIVCGGGTYLQYWTNSAPCSGGFYRITLQQPEEKK